jgi:hypothetical protein
LLSADCQGLGWQNISPSRLIIITPIINIM